MPRGIMTWTTDPEITLEGFEDLNYAISIRYLLPDGLHNAVWFSGTRRWAYLPGNEEGKEVLGLLIKAFERKLTFMVGTSITTGK